MRRKVTLVILSLAVGIPGFAWAQTRDYPSRSVRLIMPSAPGGNPDVLGRVLSQKLTEVFGKPFVVENVPGAGGVAAAELTAKAQPDGQVLMFSDSGSLAVAVALYANLPYKPLSDFTPITCLVAVPTVLVVHPSVRATTLREFVQLAKGKPGGISYGSAGTGSIHQMTMAVFAAQTGIEVLHVPYRGGTALVAAVLGNEVQAGWSGIPNVLEPIRAGTLRVLSISTEHRSASLPDVPTAIEQGVPGFDIATVIGLLGPAGMPREIVSRLQQVVARAIREPDVAQRMAALGMELRENGTENYAQFMRDDIARYAAAVKASGVKGD
jgi:tripartite-type tricarboxylate transporter receptor subunit TctC